MSNQNILEIYTQEISNLIQDIYSRPEFIQEFKKYQEECKCDVSMGDFLVEMDMLKI